MFPRWFKDMNEKEILNKYGIKFLIIDKFKQVPIDGYAFWSDNNPAIVITLRKNNIIYYLYRNRILTQKRICSFGHKTGKYFN
jgi:hypothetical protein